MKKSTTRTQCNCLCPRKYILIEDESGIDFLNLN